MLSLYNLCIIPLKIAAPPPYHHKASTGVLAWDFPTWGAIHARS